MTDRFTRPINCVFFFLILNIIVQFPLLCFFFETIYYRDVHFCLALIPGRSMLATFAVKVFQTYTAVNKQILKTKTLAATKNKNKK